MSESNWDQLIDTGIELRQELHRNPERTWKETATAAAVRAELDRLGIAWRACADTGTIGVLAEEREGRHVALRADIDALPILEDTGAAWASLTPGTMHACGHDGHTATLITAGAWLKGHENALPGPVTLLFQPAEEGGHGARRMIEDGALTGVDEIFGWHNWPAIPFGQAVCPEGTVMAGNGTFSIRVRGEGGHASQPEACRDPVPAAAAIVLALQQIVARRLPPQRSAVVSVTMLRAGETDTIIPAVAEMSGSIRFAETEMQDSINQIIKETARRTAEAWGVRAEVEIQPRYLPTVNHRDQSARYRDVLTQEFGVEALATGTPWPIMAAEDFSYYLREIPGAFAIVGAGKDGAANPPCHSPHYDFNDELIPRMARVYLRLAGAPLPD